MKTKKFEIGTVVMEMENNNFPKGFTLKRNLTYSECAHILRNLLGINIQTKEDFYDNEEYADFKEGVVADVNAWLVGDVDDSAIMEYAYDCADEPLGLFNLLPIVSYLQKKELI